MQLLPIDILTMKEYRGNVAKFEADFLRAHLTESGS